MKTLDEHNQQVKQIIQKHWAEVLCPVCRFEMKYTHPDRILTSNPPRMDVHCPECNYKGYKTIGEYIE